MLSVEEALDRIVGAFTPLPAEVVGLSEGLGRVLAEDIHSRVTQPPKDVSAMDGYAVRAEDVKEAPARLEVVGEVAAGGDCDLDLQPGQAARIFTGAPLPAGADSIVIQENTERVGTIVTVSKSAPAGHYVRPAGLDFRAGELGIAAGTVLTSRDIGLAAAMNHPWLRVRRRPRIAVLATGDEVVLPGEPLGENQILSSNGFSLAAFITANGGEPLHLGIAPDDRTVLSGLLGEAAGADLLVTCGGASVGKHDLVQGALLDEGMALDFWKIAMRPGKPLMFGRLGQTPVLGLPGNPVSSLVCALLFLRPTIAAMLGRRAAEAPLEAAVLGADLGENDERQDYLRARLVLDAQGRRLATPFQRQDSSMLATLARADCLVVREPHAPPAKAGDPVRIVPLTGGVLGV